MFTEDITARNDTQLSFHFITVAYIYDSRLPSISAVMHSFAIAQEWVEGLVHPNCGSKFVGLMHYLANDNIQEWFHNIAVHSC